MTTQTYHINGTVIHATTKQPLSNLRVEVWDKDLIFDDFVGSDATDEQGNFTITFDESYFKEIFLDRRPDLFFKIFEDDELIHDTKDSVLWNIDEQKKEVRIEVDLPVRDDEEYQPGRDQLKEIDELSNRTPAEIESDQPKLYQQIERKVVSRLRQELKNHFEDTSEELQTVIDKLDLFLPVRQKQSFRTFLTQSIRNSELSDFRRREGLIKAEAWEGPELPEDILQPNIPIKSNPLFTDELRSAGMLKIGALSQLSDEKVDQLLNREIGPEAIDQDTLDKLVEEDTLNDTEARELGLNANLYQLAGANLDLVNTVKSTGNGQEISGLRDLSSWSRTDWQSLLDENDINPPPNTDSKEYATFLQKQVELLFPHKVFPNYLQFIDEENFIPNLDLVEPLFSQNEQLFNGISFSALNLENIDPQERESIEQAYNTINRQANRYPGLQLKSVLNDRDRSTQDKLEEINRRINLMEKFYQSHENLSHLSLDYSPGSEDLEQLDLSNYAEEDRLLIINNLRANQRVYRITKDAEHTFQLMENGYHAAYLIASDSYMNFKRQTGLSDEVAKQYYGHAQGISIEVTAKFGSFIDIEKGGLDSTEVDNTSTDVHEYLKRFNGYSELFGTQDYCKCKHCQSIISPAAYFVDLMEYLKINVLNEYFPEYSPSDGGHDLDPRVRRPDLWHNLPLTCENTHTLIPYLTIILEVLENYIADRPGNEFDGDISNRDKVEDYVYNLLYNLTSLNSFRQPFLLPLSELQSYFEHFPVTQVEIAEKVWLYQEGMEEGWAQSSLRLSGREYDLISNPVSEYYLGDMTESEFLSNLYGITVPTPTSDEDLPEVKVLLGSMDLTRSQFTDLLATDYVFGGIDDSSASKPRVKAITVEGSVQPNKEVFENYTPDDTLNVLDRMHRFVRLWHQLDWSIKELDQLLGQLDSVMDEVDIMSGSGVIPLEQIARLYFLQEQLNVSIPELCALFARIPTGGSSSLFDRLFNLSPFAEENWWENPADGLGDFRHPAFRSDPPSLDGPEVLQNQHRLLAGLGVDDDELVQLIEYLEVPLDVDEVTMEFELNLDTLTVLYRHARLSRALEISIPELFVLISMSSDIENGYLESLEDVRSLVDFVFWQEESGYTIKELAKILGDEFGSEEEELTPAEISETIINNIYIEQSLIFADTAFAYFEGITESQSFEIIKHLKDNEIIEFADIQKYRIADSVTDPETIDPDVTAVEDVLDTDQKAQLKDIIRDITSAHLKDGAPDISDRVLIGTFDLSLSQSRAVLDANETIFEPIETSNLHWLSTDFNPSDAITIPEDIPLRAAKVRELILQHHAGEVVANQLGREFGLPTEKIKKLASLAGFDFQVNEEFLSELVMKLHGDRSQTVLESLITGLQKLTIWFKDDDFESEEFEFIQNHTGGNDQIFRIRDAEPNEFLNPSIEHLKQTTLFLRLVEESEEESEDLFNALDTFDFETDPPKFNDNEENIDRLKRILEAERGLINSLNQVLEFPASTDSEGAQVNHALEALNKLKANVEMAQYLGVGGEALPLLTPRRYEGLDTEVEWEQEYEDLSRGVEVLVTAIRTKYNSEDAWQEVVEPFEDRIRELKRDALTTYLIHSIPPDDPDRPDLTDRFQTEHDLYNYFLIDTELEGCARTSRVVAGISSLQLYIQRIMMDLEQTATDIEPRLKVQLNKQAQDEWEWRKNYRVWEANRKVFLYPENYIEPDLRDNKTSLFEELESELLQQEINAQTAIDAYSKYMKGFEEIARLKIAGSYHDHSGDRDVLHLFGVTPGDASQYYYRTIENIYEAEIPGSSKGIVWNAWEKLDLQIPVKKVSPIVFREKLYVFWMEITTKPQSNVIDGSSLFSYYKHSLVIKYSTLQLDGTWSTPDRISLNHSAFDDIKDGKGIIRDKLRSRDEVNSLREFLSENWESQRDDNFPPNEEIAFLKEFIDVVQEFDEETAPGSFDIHTSNARYEGVNLDFPKFRNLLIPSLAKYIESADTGKLHYEAKENYTLTGYRWKQVYPDHRTSSELMIVGRNFRMKSSIDFYNMQVVDSTPVTAVSPSLLLLFGKPIPPGSNRLRRRGSRLYYGLPGIIIPGEAYEAAVRSFHGIAPPLAVEQNIITGLNADKHKVAVVNGSLSDGIIDADGDIFLLHRLPLYSTYALKRLGTTLTEQMVRTLFSDRLEGLLDVNTQKTLREDSLPFNFEEHDIFNDALEATEKVKPIFTSSLGVYFREIFFHIPFLIANHLNSQGKFKDAQRWYHYIFDPTSDKLPEGLEDISDPAEREKREKDRVWQFIEFRNHTLQTLKEQLNDKEALQAYIDDPFNPHAIARQRLGGYMKSVVMKYIDNLLDWGDNLFAQDTMESVNEATLLYVMASQILGERPAELGDCPEPQIDDLTFEKLRDRMRKCNASAGSSFMTEVESITSEQQRRFDLQLPSKQTGIVNNLFLNNAAMIAMSHPEVGNVFTDTQQSGATNITFGDREGFSGNGIDINIDSDGYFQGLEWTEYHDWKPHFPLPSFGSSLLKQTCIFCIPHNEELLDYWDRVEDRLFKIRNCLNIEGIRRQLPLFAPEIDPMLLVRARSEGISLEDVLDSIRGDLPPYRFSFLITKAKEYAGALQSFGGALLSALEKKDAEELAQKRLIHQQNIQKLTRKIRNQEIEAAEANLETLKRRKGTITNRRNYYQQLKDKGLIRGEKVQQVTKYASNILIEIATPFQVSATAIAGLPYIIGFSNSTGAEGAKEALINTANTFKSMAAHTNRIGDLAGIEARNKRREQSWEFNLQQAENELEEIETKIKAAKIRKEIAEQSKVIHEKNKEQLQDKIDFYEDKFTNRGLYTWLSTQLKRLYREAYQNVLTIARMAERAYRFERGDDTISLLDGNYWEAGKAGLLAGERLMNDLRNMEQLYIETNDRSMEIDQAFSLTQIAPEALINLKTTGTCEFSISEFYFDLFYPGQYKRRIKSARLTIPCVTGPYTNVSATLTLVDSEIRKEPDTEAKLFKVPPTRTTTVATSTAQNDSGVFNLSFRDERYMPFEGAGAVNSKWKLSLPKKFRPFDYSTINDVILHVSYEAEYDELFREEVEGDMESIDGDIQNFLSTNSIPRLFSIRQEFSQAFHRLLNSDTGTAIDLELSEKHFPLFLQGRTLSIDKASLLLETDEGNLPVESWDNPTINIRGNSGNEDLNSFRPVDNTGLYEGTIGGSVFNSFSPSAGPLGIEITMEDLGNLGTEETDPSGSITADEKKLKDVYLLFNYTLDSS